MYSILPHPNASHSSISTNQDPSTPKPGPNVSGFSFLSLEEEQKLIVLEFLLFVEEDLSGFVESYTCNGAASDEEALILLHQRWLIACKSLHFLPVECKTWLILEEEEKHQELCPTKVLASFLTLAHQLYCYFALESYGKSGESEPFSSNLHELAFPYDDIGHKEDCIIWSKGFRLLNGPVVLKARVASHYL